MSRKLLGPTIPLAILTLAIALSLTVVLRPAWVGPVVGIAAFLTALAGIVGLARSWHESSHARSRPQILATVGPAGIKAASRPADPVRRAA